MKKFTEHFFDGMGNIESLFAAIIAQAVKDYIKAIKKNNRRTMADIEKFFLSGYGQSLSHDNGEYIIEKCKEEAGWRD